VGVHDDIYSAEFIFANSEVGKKVGGGEHKLRIEN
jgi:hypothetical protein